MSKLLIDVVRRQGRLIDVLVQAVASHAEVIVQGVPRCMKCEEPATVSNSYTGELMCDRHCAECIIDSQKLSKLLDNVPLPERSERNWIDLPYANALRDIIDHRNMITELDVVVIH